MRARIVQRRHSTAIGASVVWLVLGSLASYGSNAQLWVRAYVHGDSLRAHLDAEAAWREAADAAQGVAWAASAIFIVAALVPFVLLFRKPATAEVTIGEGAIHIGQMTIRAEDVTGLSVAPDGPGVSLAIGQGSTTTFLELDSLDDARRIATVLRKRFPGEGDLRLALPRQSPTLAVAMLSLTAVVLGVLVPLRVTDDVSGVPLTLYGSVFLLPLLVAIIVLRTRKPMQLAWGSSTKSAGERRLDRSPIERHATRHLEARLESIPEPPRVRVDLLERKDDTVASWLERIDGMRQEDGYRGAVVSRELLHEAVADVHASIDVRLAAARLLRVRDGEEPARITADIADEDVRVRVEAVMIDDLAMAADVLEKIGVFRADE